MHPFADFHRRVLCGLCTHTRTRSLSHMLTRSTKNIPEFRTAVHIFHYNNMYNIVITFIIICFTCFDHRTKDKYLHDFQFYREKKIIGIHNTII